MRIIYWLAISNANLAAFLLSRDSAHCFSGDRCLVSHNILPCPCPTSKTHLLSQDWNTFLLRFNELDFCVSENETIKHGLNESTTPESMVVTSGQARSSTQAPLLLEDSGPINISVPITLTLDPQRPFGGYSRNITHLYATVLGQQVGLSGRFSL